MTHATRVLLRLVTVLSCEKVEHVICANNNTECGVLKWKFGCCCSAALVASAFCSLASSFRMICLPDHANSRARTRTRPCLNAFFLYSSWLARPAKLGAATTAFLSPLVYFLAVGWLGLALPSLLLFKTFHPFIYYFLFRFLWTPLQCTCCLQLARGSGPENDVLLSSLSSILSTSVSVSVSRFAIWMKMNVRVRVRVRFSSTRSVLLNFLWNSCPRPTQNARSLIP